MVGRLDGKVMVISGAARGMGASHARAAAREGAKVMLADVLDDLGQALAAELSDAGRPALYVHADVTSPRDWESLYTRAVARFGRVTTIVNNAGIIGSMLDAVEETNDAWERTVAVNQTGVFLGMKYGVPQLRQAGGGTIINISSIWGVSGVGDYLAYQATKGAVRMMTKSAALSYAKEGIRVNSICPGLILTEMALEEGEENNAALKALTPMDRGADPGEVSGAVVYLASDESSYVTGIELPVDGGYLAQ